MNVFTRIQPKKLSALFILFYPFGLGILNLILKTLYLSSQDLSIDEPFSIYHAQLSLTDLLHTLKYHNNPPLFEVVLHYWIKLFGVSAFSVRLLPAVFAATAPVLLFFLAKEFFTVRLAIFSSLMLTFSDLLMFHAQECRGYSMFLVWTLFSMYFFIKLMKWGLDFKHACLFVVFTLLLIYTHYFGFFVLLIQSGYLIFFRREMILKWLPYFALILIFYAPQIIVMINRFQLSVDNGWVQKPDGIFDLYNMLWIFSNFPLITTLCIALLGLSLFKWIRLGMGANSNHSFWIILIWFLVPYLGMFFLSYFVPMFLGRYLIYALPAYYLLIGFCIEYLITQQALKILLFLVLPVLMAFTLPLNPDRKQPLKQSILLIKKIKDQQTALIVSPDYFKPTLAYHYNLKYFQKIRKGTEYEVLDSLLKKENIFCVNNSDGLMEAQINKANKLIYFSSEGQNSENAERLKAYFASYFKEVNQIKIGPTFKISFYKKTKGTN